MTETLPESPVTPLEVATAAASVIADELALADTPEARGEIVGGLSDALGQQGLEIRDVSPTTLSTEERRARVIAGAARSRMLRAALLNGGRERTVEVATRKAAANRTD